MGETRRQFLRATGAGAVGLTGAARLTGAVGVTAGQDDGVSLLLNWKPNGLHVPYYAAQARGFYEEAGVEVTNIESGQGSDFSAKQVGLGNTPLAITSADQLLNVNTRGLSPTAAGVVMQRSPVVVFTTRETFGGEFTSVDQLAGKTVGTGPGMVRILTRLLLERRGVLSDVELVDSGFDTVQQLLAGDIDAAGGVFGDAVTAGQDASEVFSIPVADAIPSYGHVVAANDDFADSNPDAVRGFLRATARGAAWATENPGEATDLLVEANSSLEQSAEVERAKWVEMANGYVLSEAVREQGWGWSESEPWATTYEALLDADLLGGEVDPESVWTNEYLDPDSEYVGDYASRVSIGETTTTGGGGSTTTAGSGNDETTTAGGGN
ncbi:ABC transporter substrate-binding protein [Halorussus litoreus]|uniref:ABC transporter substrate-binding protein n=1 Tax=Halorussus litoreus TaxID=1710536 RepID=UPI000E269591|nr:ABC transporter substrate-binding protein [Halorussus litoreus]